MNTPRIFTASATGLLTLFVLAACGSSSDSAQTSQTDSVSASPQVSTSVAETSVPSSTESADQASSSAALTYTNSDVLRALEAAQKQYANRIITSIEIHESDNTFEIDLLDGDIQQEVKVTQPGDVVTFLETNQTPEADDISNAREAKITAAEAINTALENKDSVLVDSVELEKENGRLFWTVELNNQQGQDQGEVLVDALEGSIVQQ